MPNLNAALGCAQFKYLESYIDKKRVLASKYENFGLNMFFKKSQQNQYQTIG